MFNFNFLQCCTQHKNHNFLLDNATGLLAVYAWCSLIKKFNVFQWQALTWTRASGSIFTGPPLQFLTLLQSGCLCRKHYKRQQFNTHYVQQFLHCCATQDWIYSTVDSFLLLLSSTNQNLTLIWCELKNLSVWSPLMNKRYC